MSSEVSIAKPLSGTEALDACMDSLRRQLAKDNRFQSHMAYRGFRAEISFRFYPALDFIPNVEREISIEIGDASAVEPEPTVVEKVDIPVRPPNQVREEADMPTPVLVTDGEGKTTEKWVKRAKAPKKNTVKGA